MTWTKEAKKLVKQLITDSYPELKRARILVWSFGLGPYWGAAWWPLPFLRIIVFSHKSRAIPQTAFLALAAHELGHQLIYQRDGWFKHLIRLPLVYVFLRKKIKDEENRVNKIVMERGYGQELYHLTNLTDQDPKHQRVQKFYLSAAEIKDYCLVNNLKFEVVTESD